MPQTRNFEIHIITPQSDGGNEFVFYQTAKSDLRAKEAVVKKFTMNHKDLIKKYSDKASKAVSIEDICSIKVYIVDNNALTDEDRLVYSNIIEHCDDLNIDHIEEV